MKNMKQFLFFCFFITLNLPAQNFSNIDSRVKKYPKYNSPEKLANKIAKDFKKDSEKVRAIYIWLTSNVRYDLNEYYNPSNKKVSFRYSSEKERLFKIQQIKNEITRTTFKTKKSVCEGYAQSFKSLCNLLGIEANVISGYARSSGSEIGRVPGFSDHAWNVVKLQNQWQIIDATWGAGHVSNGTWKKSYSDYFYNIDKNKANLSHYPEEEKWRVLFNDSSIVDFFNQPVYKTKFLASKIELISPTTGMINAINDNFIILKLKDLPNNKTVLYTYGSNTMGKEPKMSTEKDIKTLRIKKPSSNQILNVFIDLQLALEFKVVVK